MTEVRLDVLTGELNILRSDILFDTGISMNPAVDIGQVEGAYVQGLGYHTTEEIIYDESGKLLPQARPYTRNSDMGKLSHPLMLMVRWEAVAKSPPTTT